MAGFEKRSFTKGRIIVAAILMVSSTVVLSYQACGKFEEEGSSSFGSRVPRLIGLSGTLSTYYMDALDDSKPGKMGLHLTTADGKKYNVQVLSGPSRVGMSGAQIASTNDTAQDLTPKIAGSAGSSPLPVTVRGTPQGTQLIVAEQDLLIKLAGTNASTQSLSAGTFGVSGVRRAAIFLASVEGAPANCTADQVQKLFFGSAPSVNSIYRFMSGGNIGFEGRVFGPYQISGVKYEDDTQSVEAKLYAYLNAIANESVRLATAGGYRASDFDHDVFMFPMPDNLHIAGMAGNGGRFASAWGPFCNELDTVVHELGHNLGLPHSSIRYINGDIRVYRDARCAMGSKRMDDKNLVFFNPVHQNAISVNNPIQNVTDSGQFDITDMFNSSVTGRKVLRFRNYWISSINNQAYVHFHPPPGQEYQTLPSIPPQPVGTIMQEPTRVSGGSSFTLPDDTRVTATSAGSNTLRIQIQASGVGSPEARFWAWQMEDKSDVREIGFGSPVLIDNKRPLYFKWEFSNVQSYSVQPPTLQSLMNGNMVGETRFDIQDSISVSFAYVGLSGENRQYSFEFTLPTIAPQVASSQVLPTANGRWKAMAVVDYPGKSPLLLKSTNCNNDLLIDSSTPNTSRYNAVDFAFSLRGGATDQACDFWVEKPNGPKVLASGHFELSFTGVGSGPQTPVLVAVNLQAPENDRQRMELMVQTSTPSSPVEVTQECTPNLGTSLSIHSQSVSTTVPDTRVVLASMPRDSAQDVQCQFRVRQGTSGWSNSSSPVTIPRKASTPSAPSIAYVDEGVPAGGRVPLVLAVDNLDSNQGYSVESTCQGLQNPNSRSYSQGRAFVTVSLPQTSSNQTCQFRIAGTSGIWSNYSETATIVASAANPPQITDAAPAGTLGGRKFLTVVGIRFSENSDNEIESDCADPKKEYDGEPGMPVPGYRQINFSFPESNSGPCRVRIKRPDTNWSNWSNPVTPQ